LTVQKEEFLVWFEDLLEVHAPLTGKKALSLAEMKRAGLPVPSGFALTIKAWDFFVNETGLLGRIRECLAHYRNVEFTDLAAFEEAGNRLFELFESTPLPSILRNQILKSYDRLSEISGVESVPVAVRSSGTVSRPGLFSSFLNVSGRDMLLKKLVACWASAYSPRALAMRAQRGLPLEREAIGVVVCQFIPARSAGVLFTAHPVTRNPNQCVIEANWGLGESVVQSSVTPDRFTVNRTTFEIEERVVHPKLSQVVSRDKGIRIESISKSAQNLPSLEDQEIIALVKQAEKVERLFGNIPQDIEWAVSMNEPFPESIFFLQARPIAGFHREKGEIEKPPGIEDPEHIAELMIKRLFG